MNPREVAAHLPVVGVAVIVIHRDEILMIKRSGAHGDGTWAVPGGHVDHGERPEFAASRELYEELGIRSNGMAQCFHVSSNLIPHEGNELHYITLWFATHVTTRQYENCEPHKIKEVRFVKLTELPRPLFLPLPIEKITERMRLR